ncbi:MAG TPA: response regulator, partial [Pirellulales bacterium]|nr:response regulator [Pirellulales bacterium]
DRAYDGQSALDQIDQHEPELVILDVNMPSGSGLGVCKMLSHDLRLKSIPIVFLTGRKDEQTVRLCRELRGHYVQKGPEMWSELEPLVKQLLQLDETSPNPPTGDASNAAPQVCETSGVGAESAADESRRPGGARPWVLCIDRGRDFAESLKQRLEHQGVELVQAVAGMSGYWAAFSHPPEVILLDQQLPDGDGGYVLRRLKENPLTKDIPVIILAGSDDRALEREMYHLGATRFFRKPVDWDELWDEMRSYFRLRPQPAAT